MKTAQKKQQTQKQVSDPMATSLNESLDRFFEVLRVEYDNDLGAFFDETRKARETAYDEQMRKLKNTYFWAY